jgi:hypothetical protein
LATKEVKFAGRPGHENGTPPLLLDGGEDVLQVDIPLIVVLYFFVTPKRMLVTES